MCLYMSANPFIYSAFSAAWLIAPTSPKEGEKRRKTCRSPRSEVRECVSACVCVCVCVHWAVPDSPSTHMTEHQRAVWESVCKQRWGCSERYWPTPAHLCEQTDNLKFSPAHTCFSNFSESFILTLSSNVVIWPVVALKTEKKRVRKESLFFPTSCGEDTRLRTHTVFDIQSVSWQCGLTLACESSLFLHLQTIHFTYITAQNGLKRYGNSCLPFPIFLRQKWTSPLLHLREELLEKRAALQKRCAPSGCQLFATVHPYT